MIIYKPSDRIPIELGDLTVTLAPLTFEQKAVVFEAQIKGGKEVTDQTSTIKRAIAYSVKGCDFKGATNWDGSKCELDFKDGKLSDDSVDILMGVPDSASLIKAVSTLVRGEDIKKAGVKFAKGSARKNG
jgi:hypothetical protein